MSQTPNYPVPIQQLLSDELVTLREFAAVLGKEQHALTQSDADQLPDISQSKSELANTLGAVMREREAALASLGFGSGKVGMNRWLTTLDGPLKIQCEARWTELLALAETCQREHALNGRLIALQLAQTQQALNALTAASGITMTYGPDGQQSQRGIGSGRNLGSA